MEKYCNIILFCISFSLLIYLINGEAASFPCGIENRTPETRIVGGKVAKMNQFPWLTFIVMDEKYACTGALISDRWILTAAHCTYDTVKFHIYLGIQDYSDPNEPHRQKFTTFEKRTHPGYHKSRLNKNKHDIGLIKLPRPVEFSHYISPVCLPTYADQSYDFAGVKVTIAGWGKTSDDDRGTTTLHYAEGVEVLSNSACKSEWPIVMKIYDSILCLKNPYSHPATTCNGDSGSPINFHKRPGTPYKAIGVTSFHVGRSCTNGFPHATTRVTSYLEWIESTTGIQIDPY